jgi:hypothetical protein
VLVLAVVIWLAWFGRPPEEIEPHGAVAPHVSPR